MGGRVVTRIERAEAAVIEGLAEAGVATVFRGFRAPSRKKDRKKK